MKNVIFAAIALFSLGSCTGVAGWFGKNTDSTQVKVDSNAFRRDESITAANAYSDLFLDSSAITSFINNEKLDASKAQVLRNFYTVRNNQFAWFTSSGLTEQARGLWSLYRSDNKEKDKKDSVASRMDSLVQKDSLSIASSDSGYVRSELSLTAKLIELASSDSGFISMNNIYYLVPRKKMSVMELADSVLNKQKDSAAYASNKNYSAMREQLRIYYSAAQSGGWQPITASGLKQGGNSPAVQALKKRLAATHDYNTTDTSAAYSDSLTAAIKDVQYRYGLAPTGKVNDSLVKALNVPAEERVAQIILNMNRLIWTRSSTDNNRVEINIPAQMLYAYNDSGKALEMPVIVGEEGTNTTVFSGRISTIVFNPSWNVPESIVRNEIVPAMKKDPDYLKRKNMERSGGSDSLPVIKQLPGKDNALGEIKFLFPNSFDIYLHDTPDKSLFKKKDRRLSHGCIRVADAPGLAAFILKNDWDSAKVRNAMNGDKEQSVSVKQPVPVQISYMTAWVDDKGKMNFRTDNYNHDERSMARMFTNSPSGNMAAANAKDSLTLKKDSSRNAVKP